LQTSTSMSTNETSGIAAGGHDVTTGDHGTTTNGVMDDSVIASFSPETRNILSKLSSQPEKYRQPRQKLLAANNRASIPCLPSTVTAVSARLMPRSPSAPPALNTQSNAGGAKNLKFTDTETKSFLDVLEIHLPIGIDAWEEITRLHVETYPLSGRTVESLRRKYNALAKKKAGTGDPHIPKPV